MHLTNEGFPDVAYYVQEPVNWIEDFLSCRLWYRQIEIVNSVRDFPLTVVQSGHAIGKSFVSAAIVLWYLFNHQSPCICLTTAPTKELVRSVLWAQLSSLHLKLKQIIGEEAGELLQTELRINEDMLHRALGITAEPKNFQGIHASNMLLIFDEACSISRETFEAGESMISAAGNKTLLIGNPTEPNSYMHHCCTGKIPSYHVIKVSSTECPNVREKNDGSGLYENVAPKEYLPFPGLVSADWINQKIQTYGRHSTYCKSRVFGIFGDQAEDQLIPGRDLALAILKGAQLRALLKHLEEANHIMRSDEIHKIIGR